MLGLREPGRSYAVLGFLQPRACGGRKTLSCRFVRGAMHVVGLRYENASGALAAGALKTGAKVTFRHKFVSAEHPDAYVAYCSRFKIGFMPRFGSQLLKTAGYSSPITSTIRTVSGAGHALAVVVDIYSPFGASPPECSLTRPTTDGLGVYAIVNVRNMKAYIGSTESFERRRKQHLQLLERGEHFSPNLQRDWKEDPSAFAFVVVDIAPAELGRKEQHRIYISSTGNPAFGYNQGAGFSPAVEPRPHSSHTQPTLYPSRTASGTYASPATISPLYHGTGAIATPAASSQSQPATHSSGSQQHRSASTTHSPQSSGCLILLAIGCGFCGAVTGLGVLLSGLIL